MGEGIIDWIDKRKWVIIIILLVFTFFAPILFTSFNIIDFSNTGEIGDTIGGITAPFVNLVAAFLVYISFREQIKANKLLSKESSFNYFNSTHKIIAEDLSQITPKLKVNSSYYNMLYEEGVPRRKIEGGLDEDDYRKKKLQFKLVEATENLDRIKLILGNTELFIIELVNSKMTPSLKTSLSFRLGEVLKTTYSFYEDVCRKIDNKENIDEGFYREMKHLNKYFITISDLIKPLREV
jgi:hypothetical protein